MKPTVIIKTLVLGLLLAGITQGTLAQQRGDRDSKTRTERMHDRWQHADRMPMLPNLTDDQKSQIKELILATRQEMLPLRNQMGEKLARLKTLRSAEKVDMKAINGIADDIGSLRTQIMKRRLASEQQIRELLTDEQRVVFDSRPMMEMHRGHKFNRGR